MRPVKRQVQSRTDADFQDASFGTRDHPLPILQQLAVGHREVDDVRQDVIVVKAHAVATVRSAAENPRLDRPPL